MPALGRQDRIDMAALIKQVANAHDEVVAETELHAEKHRAELQARAMRQDNERALAIVDGNHNG